MSGERRCGRGRNKIFGKCIVLDAADNNSSILKNTQVKSKEKQHLYIC